MEDRIRNLDDATAVRLLNRISDAYRRPGDQTELTPQLRDLLTDAFGPVDDTGETSPGDVTPGEVARQALLLLAEDPELREGIAASLDYREPESLSVGEIVGAVSDLAVVGTSALVVLQLYGKVGRGKDGKLIWEIGKKPASDGLLRDLVKSVVRIIETARK